MQASAVFGCDYTDLNAVIELAKQFVKESPNTTFYVTKRDGCENYNITMQQKRTVGPNVQIMWQSK